jgi:hypothetical protein
MFTWICPQCGREVPPAYNECPDCAAKAAAPVGEQAGAPAPAAAQARPPEAPPAAIAPERPLPAAQHAAVAPPAWEAPPVRRAPPPSGLPTWLLAIVFAFAFVGLGAAIYWTAAYLKGGNTKPTAAVESPAAKAGAKVNPLQKYVEITGVRFVSDPKDKTKTKVLVRCIVINHSEADLSGLAGNVTIWGRTQKSEEDAEGTFTFSTNLRPFEAKEIEQPLNTKLKIYELPDWQNVTTDVQITAPQ